jgi:hypothetical protein
MQDIFLRAANSALCLIQVFGRVDFVRWGKATKDEENGCDDATKDNEFSEDWSAGTEIGPLARSFGNISLDLLSTKLEPYHSTKSNCVSEALKRRNEISPDNDRKAHEKDILQDTAEREDEDGSFADLNQLLALKCDSDGDELCLPRIQQKRST